MASRARTPKHSPAERAAGRTSTFAEQTSAIDDATGPPPPPEAKAKTGRWWAGFFVIVAFALHFTRLAYNDELPDIFRREQADKVFHFLFAGLLAFFLDGALRRRVLVSLGELPIPLAAVGVLVPAGIEEFMQRFAITRTSSIWDFAADTAGVVVLLALGRRFAR
jgi:VanZ family protein